MGRTRGNEKIAKRELYKIGKKVFIYLLLCIMLSGCSKSVEQQVAEQLELGQKYLSEMEYEQAIVAFDKVISLNPKVWEAYIGIANAYDGQEKYDDAEAAIESGMKQVASEETRSEGTDFLIELYRTRARAAKQANENELAQTLFEKILALREDDEEALRETEEYQKLEAETRLSKLSSPTLGEILRMIQNSDDGSIWETLITDNVEEIRSLLRKLGKDFIGIQDGSGKELRIYTSKGMCEAIYYGDIQNDIRNGEGIWWYVWLNGDGNIVERVKFNGNWEDDYPNGYGELTYDYLDELEPGHSRTISRSGNYKDGYEHGERQKVVASTNGLRICSYKAEMGTPVKIAESNVDPERQYVCGYDQYGNMVEEAIGNNYSIAGACKD